MSPPKSQTWSVVLPVYDEQPETITSIVTTLATTWDEVIICADTPSDALKGRLSDLNDQEIKLSLSQNRRGKGKAIRDGLTKATGDIIGYVDADGAVSIDGLEQLYEHVASGETDAPDVVVGSRHKSDIPATPSTPSENESRSGQPLLRRILGRGYNMIGRTLTRVSVTDFQCGAKAFTQESWSEVAPAMTIDGFGFDTQLLNQFALHGCTIHEEPIGWHDPGDTTVSVTTVIPHMLYTLFTVWTATLFAALPLTGNWIISGQNANARRRLGLVSSHPPNHGHLAEYGQELADAYSDQDDITVTVHTNADGYEGVERPNLVPQDTAGSDSYEVRPSWERDSAIGAFTLCKALLTEPYDIIHFNVHMTYFGDSNVYRFVGLTLPALMSLHPGTTIVTTLHDMLEIVNEDQFEDDISFVERIGATVATQVVLLSDVTTVTSEEYRCLLEEKYFTPNLRHVPHGTFTEDVKAELGTDAPSTETQEQYSSEPADTGYTADGGTTTDEFSPVQLLVFGHLSPIKDIETVVDAFAQFRDQSDNAELVIAGDSHPDYDDYLANLKSEYGQTPGVRFTGYVPDDDLDEVWLSATILIMPYNTITGVSGVFQLAKTYGTPVIATDIPGMREATIETGGDARFVPPDNPQAIADEIDRLLASPDELTDLGEANYRAADEFTITDTAETVVSLAEEAD